MIDMLSPMVECMAEKDGSVAEMELNLLNPFFPKMRSTI
jgi:hypothetical protein